KKTLHLAGDQSAFAVKQGRHVLQFLGADVRLVDKLLGDVFGIMLLHLEEGIYDIQLVGLLLEGTDKCQIGNHEAGRRLCHNVPAQEPVNKAVVKFEVCGQRAATQRGAAQYVGKTFIAGQPVITLGEKQGNI